MARATWANGGNAWRLLAAAIATYELITPPEQLLTAACERGIKRHPIAVRAAIIVTALHLLGLIPRRIDPYAHLPGVRKHVSESLHRLIRPLPR
jgi:hypothetical protein